MVRRSTRGSVRQSARLSGQNQHAQVEEPPTMQSIASVKVREWTESVEQVGHFKIKVWVPKFQRGLTKELHVGSGEQGGGGGRRVARSQRYWTRTRNEQKGKEGDDDGDAEAGAGGQGDEMENDEDVSSKGGGGRGGKGKRKMDAADL